MLTAVSETSGKNPIVAAVARELSLTLNFFDDAESLALAIKPNVRRLVLLTEPDIRPDVVEALGQHRDEALALIVAADYQTLRSSERAQSFVQLEHFKNIQWIHPDPDVTELSAAARACRRAMLRLSEDELRQAIERKEFVIQYQPKVERGEGDDWITHEAEALLRWKHPMHGLLGPLEFLPELEAFDLMAPVSELVFRDAAEQLLKWGDRGLDLNSCINLAPSLLSNSRLANDYASIADEFGLDCSRFTFEVAEHDVTQTDAPHLRVLQSLRDQGFRVSLDDFGAAQASLSAFEQLPFDEIKIHASALKRAMQNPIAQHVLAAVTGLAHNLDIAVCAEGVEDQQTFDFLKTIECDKMQGFLISEAVMPDIIRHCYRAGEKVEDVA